MYKDNVTLYKFICRYGTESDAEYIRTLSRCRGNHNTKIYKAQLKPTNIMEKVSWSIFMLIFTLVSILWVLVGLIYFMVKDVIGRLL